MTDRERLRAAFERAPSGRAWCRIHSDAVDGWVRAAHAASGVGDAFAVVATGGYGRREMSPRSDVDLTVVPRDDAGDDDAVRRLYRELHTALADEREYEFGYALRLVADAAGLDAKTQAGLLDARLVAGSPDPLEALLEAFEADFSPADFLIAKLAERDEALRREGGERGAAEPHLKDSAGGLRAFHTANWIAWALGRRPRPPGDEVEILLLARNALHIVAGRKSDRLTRARQGEVAALLGRTPDELMRGVGEAAARLEEGFDLARRSIRRASFRLSEGADSVAGEARPRFGADAGEAATGIALAATLGLWTPRGSFDFLPARRSEAVLNALARGERAVRDLDRCGLLGYLLPEIEPIRHLVPGDPSHALTVLEHSFRVLAILDELDDPLLSDLQNGLSERGVLVLAALLHDAGKADPRRPHEESGAELALAASERLRLPKKAESDLGWLVREHLTMVAFLRLRDLEDETTAREFAALVETPERLAMLTLLSYADVSATGPGAWTPSQDASLRRLFRQTAAVLAGEEASHPSAPRRRWRRLGPPTPPDRIAAFLDRLPATYLVATDPAVVPLHLEMVARAEAGEVALLADARPELAATEVTVAARDRPRLLERILAVVYAHDLSVAGFRVATAAGETPIALDHLQLASHRQMLSAGAADRLLDDLQRVLEERLDEEDLLRRRGKDPERGPGILWHRYVPGVRPVLELRAPRGRGVPYRLAKWIAAHGWSVTSARLGQWGPYVAAAFYLDPGRLDAEGAAAEVERAISSLA